MIGMWKYKSTVLLRRSSAFVYVYNLFTYTFFALLAPGILTQGTVVYSDFFSRVGDLILSCIGEFFLTSNA